MTYGSNIVKPLAAANWTILTGSDATTWPSNNSIKYTGVHYGAYSSAATLHNAAPATLRVYISYCIDDTTDMLYPHDDPTLNKMTLTIKATPTDVTDTDDPNYGQPKFFWHLLLPFSQSNYTSTVKVGPSNLKYVTAKMDIDVPVEMYEIQDMSFMVVMRRPGLLYSLTVQPGYY